MEDRIQALMQGAWDTHVHSMPVVICFIPVVFVLHIVDVLAADPLVKHPGARARIDKLIEHGVTLFLMEPHRDDKHIIQTGFNQRGGLGEEHFYGVIVDLFAADHVEEELNHNGGIIAETAKTIDVIEDLIRVEGFAVAELDSLLQMEGDFGTVVVELPRLRQDSVKVSDVITVDQGLIHLLEDRSVGQTVHLVRIHRHDIGACRHIEGLAVLSRGGGGSAATGSRSSAGGRLRGTGGG